MKIIQTTLLSLISLCAANAAVIYFQDFLSVTAFGSDLGGTLTGGVSGSATDGAFTVDYTSGLNFNVNQANGVINGITGLDTVNGIAVRNNAEFDFTTETISTSFGDLVIEVDSAVNTAEDVILQSVSVFDDGSQLYFDVTWASDKGDWGIGGNEAVFVTATLDGTVTGFGDIGEGTGAANSPSGGTERLTLVAAVPEPSSASLLGLGGLALVTRRKRS